MLPVHVHISYCGLMDSISPERESARSIIQVDWTTLDAARLIVVALVLWRSIYDVICLCG